MASSPLPFAGPGAPGEVCPLLSPLHASEMRLYQACPRKWHHAYVSRRVARAASEALSRGTAVHAYLAEWWRGSRTIELPEDPVARACCIGYGAYWGAPPPALPGWQVEQRFDGVLIGDVEVAGTLDAFCSDMAGQTIVEHKTTSQDISPGSMYWRSVVTTDVQVSMYRAAFPGAKILYDVIRKPALRPLRAGKPNEETSDEYVARMVEAMASEPEKYFQRATVVRLESEDEAFARDVVSVDRLRRGKEHPRNAAQCFAYGQRCEYFGVCWEGQSLADDSVFKESDR